MTRAQWGMCLAHFGVGVFVLGATFVSAYELEVDGRAVPGQRFAAGDYAVTFLGTRQVTGPNYMAVEGEFELWRNGRLVSVLRPQKRVYQVQTTPITQTAIDNGLRRDVLLSLGEPLGDGAWSLRVQIKPFVRFIWLGTLIMVLGGIIASTDRRGSPVRPPN